MKESVFNALPTYTETQAVTAATVGDNFFLGADEAAQLGNVAIRGKITYHTRIELDTDSNGGQDASYWVQKYDLLESDILTQETKTGTRRGKNRDAGRDDDPSRDIISETPWT